MLLVVHVTLCSGVVGLQSIPHIKTICILCKNSINSKLFQAWPLTPALMSDTGQ